MNLAGTSIQFQSFHEAQIYVRAARAVFTMDPPNDPGDREKYTEGEWDLLFQLALRMAEGDTEWATELVRSVVVPTIFMAALELARWFEEVPSVWLVLDDDTPVGAYLLEEEATAQAALFGEGGTVQAMEILSGDLEEVGD